MTRKEGLALMNQANSTLSKLESLAERLSDHATHPVNDKVQELAKEIAHRALNVAILSINLIEKEPEDKKNIAACIYAAAEEIHN